MANTNAPRGFQPRKDAYGGTAPVINSYKIPSGYATALYSGDVVKFLTTGYIAKAAAGDQMRGICLGFKYNDSTNRPVQSAGWSASTVTWNAQDVTVLVLDNPNTVFEARFCNSASVPAFADVGATFNLFDAGGVAGTGVSGEGADYSTLNTTAQQFRFVGFATRPDNDTTSAYSLGLFVPALHDFRVNTGI